MPVSFVVATAARTDFVEITDRVARVVAESGLSDGTCLVYTPHTTAAITVNENADPDVTADLARRLDRLAPWDEPTDRHGEGNSAAHLKSSLVGCSASLIVAGGRPLLGTWQGIYLCDFDGPRRRTVFVRVGP